jgi:hypothetical protein
MSFEPPAGILDIGNATLRVGKLEVAETSGLNQGLQNIVKNDLLITETTEYTTNQTWGLKLPTAWVADFDIKGGTGKYVEFNFYNEGSTSNAQGYTLHFEDTTLTLKYDNGSTLASATIPTIVGTYRKVNIFFERNVVAVSIDGTRYLYDKRPSVLSRVISTTGSAFLNAFFESDHGGNSGFKNLRIVNGRFISDKTSNVSFIGSLGVGVNSPTESLDVLGNIKTTANVHAGGEIELYSNLNIQHVSNTSTIQANSNVVTEFPRSKKLVKYPRVVLTANGLNQGYTVSGSNDYSSGLTFYGAFTPPTTLSTPSGAWLTPTSGTNGYSTSTGEYGYSEQLHSASLTGEYVQIVLPEKINPVYFTVQPYPESANNNEGLLSCINEGEIWASNDSGTTWTPVGKIQNFTPTGLYQEHIVDNFNVPGYYDTFALIIHKNNGHPFAGVGEWKIFGTPEYDPDAHGTDVVVKSPPNVPNTDWLDVYYDGQDYTSTPATVTDNSGNNLTGTLNGGVGFDTGYKAFTFDGVDDYISNIQSGYTSSNTYTVGMWFNRTANIQGALFQYGINSSTPTAIGMFYYGSANHYITSYIAGGARADTDFNASYLSLNEWNHAASVYSPEGVTLYINGVMVAKNTLVSPTWNNSITIPTSPHLTIGAQGDTSTGVYPTTYFTGSIANFRLFKRALTSDELWQLYAYQKEYFGRGDLSMTLKAGRLGIGTSEPRAALDVRGDANLQSTIYGPLSTFETVNFTSIYATTWTSTQGANETELVLLTATVKVPDIYKHLGKHQLKIYYTWHWVGEAGRYDPGTTTLDTDGGGYYFFQFRTRTSHNGTVQNMHAGNVSSIIKVVSPIAVSLPNNDHSTLDQSVIPGIFTLTDAFAGDDITIDLTGVWTSDAYGQVRTNRTMQDGNSSSYERGVTTLCVWFKPII